MKILLHICCGPCAIYPLKVLKTKGLDVMGFYYRHNIHPFTECVKRQETLRSYAESINLPVIYQEGYDLEGFLQKMIFRESKRCSVCYHERLRSTALIAKRGKFNYFSTTLLYSKFQKHDMIRSMGESIGKSVGVPFYYHDFREGWKEGIEESKRLEMYRQQYCGCIYSEKERFFKT
ncbi:MAG: epoxyqueuosine reductase QueH [Deltaproteobacteria bacterium]|nr:epoxyqueuosine reductase QueH [Deltaproteobacteria bacterium]MBW2100111.1 epoxyqueuosine reductase QueH [Deltaproteobacteria bacterium]